MVQVQRRRSPRYPADLPARYRFESTAAWRECCIVDVSKHGAALELEDFEPGAPFGTLLDLEVCSVAPDAVGVVLQTQVRRHNWNVDNRLVVGVEFMPTAAECADLLRLLVDLHSLTVDT